MLKTQKSSTINGQCMVDNTVVVYLTATIPENGNVSINQTIQDKALFEKNKKQCLADIAEFQEKTYSLGEESGLLE